MISQSLLVTLANVFNKPEAMAKVTVELRENRSKETCQCMAVWAYANVCERTMH